MLAKLKDVIAASDKLQELVKTVDAQSQKLADLQRTITTLHESVSALAISHSQALTNVNTTLTETRTHIDGIETARKKLDDEIFQFRTLKGHLQSKLVERFDNELKQELKRNTEDLQTHKDEYNKLKADIHTFTNTLARTADEIQKWLTLSQQIKAKDFEFSKSANHVAELGAEKKALLEKVDMLERLVGKIRRSTQAR
ncbi:hypothetical protein HY490_00600 [Candidatus Woesearchaeota archaeon]|nr:hypothetical protein [Candidatus Woesearchaeota archaeon]